VKQNSNNKVIFCDKPKIVILEDDKGLSLSLKLFLEKSLNAEVIVFNDGKSFIDRFVNSSKKIEGGFCLLADVSLGDGHDGLFLLDLLSDTGLNFFSIVMTGFASVETAISATKKGVFHYLTKPFDLEDLNRLIVDGFAKKLRTIIHNVNVIKYSQKESNAELSMKEVDHSLVQLPTITEDDYFEGLVGRTDKMQQIFERVKKIAQLNSPVLITGEAGTGKEVLAQAIHHLSVRSDNGGKLTSINCRAIPEDLLESELFGHTEGAFTGAISNREGRFAIANKSSIFIDQIDETNLELQQKIVDLCIRKSILPLGAKESLPIDVRLMAASNKNLEESVELRKFSKELFYELNVFPIHVPPLRERKGDIPLLISFFLKKYVSADKSNMIRFTQSAFDQMASYIWPGNVRELEQTVEKLVVQKGGSIITIADLPNEIYQGNPLTNRTYKDLFELPEEGVMLKNILSDIENSLIIQALDRTKGNKNRASQLLGLNRTTLIEKIKKKQLLS